MNNLRTSDPYMVMADFADYRRAQNDLSGLYLETAACRNRMEPDEHCQRRHFFSRPGV